MRKANLADSLMHCRCCSKRGRTDVKTSRPTSQARNSVPQGHLHRAHAKRQSGYGDSTKPTGNLLTVQIHTTRDEITYSHRRFAPKRARAVCTGKRFGRLPGGAHPLHQFRPGDWRSARRSWYCDPLTPDRKLRIEYGYAVDAHRMFVQTESFATRLL